MTMRVLITGVNGFAGSQPAEYILAKRPQLHGMAPSTGSGQVPRIDTKQENQYNARSSWQEQGEGVLKRALVCGSGGFIGGHLVKKLNREGYWVRGVDIKEHEFAPTAADEFLILDLRETENCKATLSLEERFAGTGWQRARHPLCPGRMKGF